MSGTQYCPEWDSNSVACSSEKNSPENTEERGTGQSDSGLRLAPKFLLTPERSGFISVLGRGLYWTIRENLSPEHCD